MVFACGAPSSMRLPRIVKGDPRRVTPCLPVGAVRVEVGRRTSGAMSHSIPNERLRLWCVCVVPYYCYSRVKRFSIGCRPSRAGDEPAFSIADAFLANCAFYDLSSPRVARRWVCPGRSRRARAPGRPRVLWCMRRGVPRCVSARRAPTAIRQAASNWPRATPRGVHIRASLRPSLVT